MTEEYQKIEIKQQRGPAVRFTGTLLAETEFTTRGRDPMLVRFEIWETKRGALIAMRSSEPVERDGYVAAEVAVVEPLEVDDDTRPTVIAQHLSEMRFAVMRHFEWHDRARSMVRKQLKWSLVQEVA